MRKEITEEELLELLNLELKKDQELIDCRITSVQWHEKDGTGCNWSAGLRTSGVPAEIFKPQVDQIVAKFMAGYNLLE